jgi:hypothetical protein
MYYHVSTDNPRKWTKLDRDLALAKRLWAEIEGEHPDPNNCTFSGIAARYRKEVFPTKAFQTQKDNEKELAKLEAVFGVMPISGIKPHHIKRYLVERGKTAKVRANREKALFSHIYNFAREHGYRSEGCDALLQDGKGQRLTAGALRTRFDKAREAAGVSFQFRDIRAKTATDTENLAHAQKLLGHKSRAMTEHYTRNRKGEKVSPLK